MFYVVLRKNLQPRSEWPDDLLNLHITWAKEEDRKGRLLLSGPTGDKTMGIYLIKAESLTAAESIVQTDPVVISGHCSFELHEWDIQRGSGLFNKK